MSGPGWQDSLPAKPTPSTSAVLGHQRHVGCQDLLRTIRMYQCKAEADHATEAIPDQRHRPDALLVNDQCHPIHLALDVAACRDPTGIPKPPEIQRRRLARRRQVHHSQHPVAPRSQPAVEKQQNLRPTEGLVVCKAAFENSRPHRLGSITAATMGCPVPPGPV